MDGFFNTVLHIDVTEKSFREEPINDDVFRKFLGGKGLATYLLLNNTKAGVDPLSAENVIIFPTGPAMDTKIFGSSRFAVITKSPLTGIYGEAYAGGKVAGPLSRTGYDAIVIKGISADPVYLEVTNKKVLFHDAAHIWGKDTHDAEDVIRSEVGIKGAEVVVIGPAAENLVKFGIIANNYWRSLSRTGPGTVMGSKKIKGIAFYGDKQRKVAHPELLNEFCKETKDRSKEDPRIPRYFREGTLQSVTLTNEAGAFPSKYWTTGTYDKWKNLNIDGLKAKCTVRSVACPKCFISCAKLSEVTTGRHKGLKIEGPEFATINAFGGQCLIDDITEIAYLNDICDRLGMDTVSAGNIVAFAIEAAKRKPIGLTLEYGDVDGIADLLHKMARREGIGDILAEGVRYAAKEWGLEDLAIHVKGLEVSDYEPRVLKGMALAYAISDRGACNLRATVYAAELAGKIAPETIEGKAKAVFDLEDQHALFDALILCRFFRGLYQWEQIARIIHATTGMDLDKKQLQEIASNIANKTREFNLREGMTAAADTLPKRFFSEKLEDSGKGITEDEFMTMRSEYYALRSWN
ncbi:MAG: aldehyde ferredoxin oxidoreductase family protein [Deltaproteobacteria bacterium]|nr:aldehyde ferredoxin oxidoreductase family protein [Deltaproteobacteria bacterium]